MSEGLKLLRDAEAEAGHVIRFNNGYDFNKKNLLIVHGNALVLDLGEEQTHLDRPDVEALVMYLQRWLKHGKFTEVEGEATEHIIPAGNSQAVNRVDEIVQDFMEHCDKAIEIDGCLYKVCGVKVKESRIVGLAVRIVGASQFIPAGVPESALDRTKAKEVFKDNPQAVTKIEPFEETKVIDVEEIARRISTQIHDAGCWAQDFIQTIVMKEIQHIFTTSVSVSIAGKVVKEELEEPVRVADGQCVDCKKCASPCPMPSQVEVTIDSVHSGSKYLRRVTSPLNNEQCLVDVYAVLDAYRVESQPVGHAIKKLLMAGQRGAKDRKTDLQEAIDALQRAVQMEGGDA